jgi:hypothetical protein
VYAVRPTVLAQINCATGPNSSNSIMLFLAPSGGKWCEVWTKPPSEKQMAAAFRGEEDARSEKEKAVKASGVTDYKYEANPTEFTRLYTWQVRMTAADSKNEKYEIVQIDHSAGGAEKTSILVERPSLAPNDDGFVGFKLGIGDKPDALKANGGDKLYEPFQFSGLGNGIGDSGQVSLPAGALGGVAPAGTGATLVDGTLRLIRFNMTDAKGGACATDVVLRAAVRAPTGGDKMAAICSWDPGECSHPLMVPAGYHAWENGAGKYHVAQDQARGSIAITFQAKGTLDPERVPGARESPFRIRGRQFDWRVYKTEADGKPIIRKEIVIPNILPRDRAGDEADYIWVRIDAATQDGIDALTPVAGGIIRDSQ